MKTKKLILIILTLCLLFSMGVGIPIKLIRLSVINKSGDTVYIHIEGQEFLQKYYLTIDKGSKLFPALNMFTIVPDLYLAQVWYQEDKENDSKIYRCYTDESKDIQKYDGTFLYLYKNAKLVILPCGTPPPNLGDKPSGLYKWHWTYQVID